MKKVTPRKRKALHELHDNNVKRRIFDEIKQTDVKKLKAAKNVVKTSRRYLYKKKTPRINESKIKDFFKREDISRLVPQKRFATKEGPGYLMQVSIMAAHSKFTAEYGRTVSLSKFAQVRPRNVRKLAMSHREYCVCVYCINVRYKLLSLSRAVMDPCKKKYSEGDIFDIVLCAKGDADSYHKPECINGTCKHCSHKWLISVEQFYQEINEHKVLTWSRWEKEGDTQRRIVTKKTQKGSFLRSWYHWT
ncbi:unnamed protein product [Mytilus coruscus]|uniref:Uncharacterized protein n=1 Tax=Mytilus coruscus TaxID=42192 RepID=A0A6J8EM06_MYTCO|nr:unnamed protein product [Mytilus coruscus]